MKRYFWLIGIVLALLLAACAPSPPPVVTRTPLPTVASSPTVAPVIPTVDTSAAVGANNPTAAAVPNDGDVNAAVPRLTEEPFTVTASSDGLELRGMLYRADREPAPAVLLLHMLSGRRQDWEPLITPLQEAGYTVLAMDMRGHGATGSAQDWELARQDVVDMLAALRDVDGVDGTRVAAVGASIGANLALIGCSTSDFCRTAVLLSPGLDYRGVTTEAAMTQMGERPVLLVASEEDTYSAQSSRTLADAAQGVHELMMYSGAGHGTRMFRAQPDLVDAILNWLNTHL